MKLEEVIQSLEDMLDAEGGLCSSSIVAEELVIKADRAALIELAWQLLKMADKEYIDGVHQHFDEHNFLDESSVPIIVERTDTTERK
jgi:hypothetical protein